jgi:hypothetical protein
MCIHTRHESTRKFTLIELLDQDPADRDDQEELA